MKRALLATAAWLTILPALAATTTPTTSAGATAGAAASAVVTTLFNQAVTAATTVTDTVCASTNGGGLLPAGYLSTKGNQIVDSSGNSVRIASVGWNQIWGDLGGQISQMRDYGFNAMRVSWTNAAMDADMAQIKLVVAAASQYGMKVVLDHHTDEEGTAGDGMGAQQMNGLWYDVGPGSDGTNGVGVQGTVDVAKFQRDWVSVAQMFAGNPTVIGFDLDNEPLFYGNSPSGGVNWGQGGPNDIQVMYQTVGNAIHVVNPGVLIIAEGPIGDGQQGHPKDFDLSGVKTHPVVLSDPGKLVYSIHSYPTYVGGMDVDSGPALVQMMNNDWGFLLTQNIAPVWIGEMGANFDGTYGNENIADSQAWFQTILQYTSGQDAAQGGPSFAQGQTGISWDWWAWGNNPGQQLDGTMTNNGVNQIQKNAVDQLIVGTCAKALSVLRSLSAPATDAQVTTATTSTPTTSTAPATQTAINQAALTYSYPAASPAPSTPVAAPATGQTVLAPSASPTVATATVTQSAPVMAPVSVAPSTAVPVTTPPREKRRHRHHTHEEWNRWTDNDD